MIRRPHPLRSSRRPIWRMLLLVLCGILLGALFGLWRAVRYEPDFYRAALAVTTYREAEASERLEQDVRQLQARVQHDSTWETEYSEQQLNAWLAVELPQKFPQFLPPELSEPRVSIDSQRVRIAGRYVGRSISPIVSIEFQVLLTDRPNEVALRVRRVRAGAIPVPIEKWLAELEQSAQRSQLPLRIDSIDGDPVLLLDIPAQSSAWPERQLIVERLELEHGKIKIAGRSESE